MKTESAYLGTNCILVGMNNCIGVSMNRLCPCRNEKLYRRI